MATKTAIKHPKRHTTSTLLTVGLALSRMPMVEAEYSSTAAVQMFLVVSFSALSVLFSVLKRKNVCVGISWGLALLRLLSDKGANFVNMSASKI
jgi:hypothetical protein